MFDDPFEQRLVEADIPANAFALDPFVPKDLVTLGLKFPVKKEVLDCDEVLIHVGGWNVKI